MIRYPRAILVTVNPMTPSSVQLSAEGYQLPQYSFSPPPELSDAAVPRHALIIVGGGLAGLTLACDLAQRGIHAVLLDEDDTVGVRGASSRGIVYAQRTLEIFAGLGIYSRIQDKGVTWSVGRTFDGDDEVYSFNRGAGNASRQAAFINIQQFYIEAFLVERISALGVTDLRWRNRVTRMVSHEDHVELWVDTPAGSYRTEAQWLVDATGANSALRDSMGLDTHASRSPDRWCITDVRFNKQFPSERWTWIRAPFNDDRAVWQHLMADEVWRVDFQMGPDADPEYVSKPEVAAERLRAYLGQDLEFEFVWIGPYQYRDHLLDEFLVGRVFFIGDSAHVVSPFGARGGNSGVQDAANLGWKLSLALKGQAPQALLESYQTERHAAAVENLKVASITARFLASLSPIEQLFRDAVLGLAREHPFARGMVNTGRMSVGNAYPASPLAPTGAWALPNVEITLASGERGGVLDLLQGGFVAIVFADSVPPALSHAQLTAYACGSSPLTGIGDPQGQLSKAARAGEGDMILLRPDGYCAGRWRRGDTAGLMATLDAYFGEGMTR